MKSAELESSQNRRAPHSWRYISRAMGGVMMLASSLPLAAQNALPPDLHAGGPQPSSIPNHQTTLVTLPGLHLAGSTLTVSGVCSLESYKVASDSSIEMKITGKRTIDDKDDGCFLTVHKGAKQAGTYVVVELTDAETEQQSKAQSDAAMVKEKAYMASLGTLWTVHFADGATEVLTAQPADPGQLPDFTSSSGGTAKILISQSGVVIVLDACILSGTVTGNQVKDGSSQGSCKHSGSWTAEKK